MSLRRSPQVIHEVVDGRAMLVTPDGAELLSLNVVGTMVWELIDDCDGDPGRVAERLISQFEGVSRDQLEADVREFLDELREQGLVVEVPA